MDNTIQYNTTSLFRPYSKIACNKMFFTNVMEQKKQNKHTTKHWKNADG